MWLRHPLLTLLVVQYCPFTDEIGARDYDKYRVLLHVSAIFASFEGNYGD